MATPVPTSPITVKRTTARRGLFQSDGHASDATTSSSSEPSEELSEESSEEPTSAPSEPSLPSSPRDEDLARAETNARTAADAEAKSNARLGALDESWAAQEATIQLLEARALREWKDARHANDRKQAVMDLLAKNEARRDLAQARAADARQAAGAARLEAAEAASQAADAKVHTARLEERVAAAAAVPVPSTVPPPAPPDTTARRKRDRALADAKALAEEHDRLRFAVDKAEARLAAALDAADVRERIGALATAQSDAKAQEAIAAVRQLRDVVRDGDPRKLAAKLAAARPRRRPPTSPVTAPAAPAPAPIAAPAAATAVTPAVAPAAAPAATERLFARVGVREREPARPAAAPAAPPEAPTVSAPVAAPAPAPSPPPSCAALVARARAADVSGDDTVGDDTLSQTDDATAGSATLAGVYEELGDDFNELETALRKCDAAEADIAAVHAVLERAAGRAEVGE